MSPFGLVLRKEKKRSCFLNPFSSYQRAAGQPDESYSVSGLLMVFALLGQQWRFVAPWWKMTAAAVLAACVADACLLFVKPSDMKERSVSRLPFISLSGLLTLRRIFCLSPSHFSYSQTQWGFWKSEEDSF